MNCYFYVIPNNHAQLVHNTRHTTPYATHGMHIRVISY